MAAVQISSTDVYGNLDVSIVTCSNGTTIYIFAIDNPFTSLRIFKSTDTGATWGELTALTSTTIHGTAVNLNGVDAAIDGSGYIHVVSYPDAVSTRFIAYNRLNTSNDTWGSWEEAAVEQDAITAQNEVSIAVDSSSYPHIMYADRFTSMGNSYRQVYYTNKTSGSWSAPVGVGATAATNYFKPKIIVRNSDVIEAYYVKTLTQPAYRTRTSGSWGSESTYTDRSATTFLRHSLTSTTSGTVYRYEGYSSTLYENDVSIGTGSSITAAIYDSVRYVIYMSSGSLYYISNDGTGWSGATAIDSSGVVYRNSSEWAYNFEYQSSRINIVYKDTSQIPYYTYIPITTETPVSDNNSAYTEGVVRSSIHAFMPGPFDVDPAITYAALIVANITPFGEVTTSTHAYLKGSIFVTDNQTAYILGVLGGRTNISAYAEGYQEVAITTFGPSVWIS